MTDLGLLKRTPTTLNYKLAFPTLEMSQAPVVRPRIGVVEPRVQMLDTMTDLRFITLSIALALLMNQLMSTTISQRRLLSRKI